MSSLIQKHAHVKGQRSHHHIFKFQPNRSWAKNGQTVTRPLSPKWGQMATDITVLAIFDPRSPIGNSINFSIAAYPVFLRQNVAICIQYPDISYQSGPGRK